MLLLSVHSDTVPLITVDDYANIFLAQQISQVSGVAQVSVFGDRTPSIRIQVDPAKLAANGLTLEEIRGTLVTSTTNAAKGMINADKITFTIAANDQITDAEQIQRCHDRLPQRRADPGARCRPGGRRTGRPHRRRLSEQQGRRHPRDVQAARRQRHRHRRPDQGGATAAHSAHSAGGQGRNHSRPHRDHPRLGVRRRVHADAHHLPRGDGDPAVPAQFLGDAYSEHDRAAGARRLVRGDVFDAISASTICR